MSYRQLAPGWRKDSLDRRDKIQRAPPQVVLPVELDQRGLVHPGPVELPLMPPIYDQLQVGSCTGNGTAGAIDYARAKQGLPFIGPSRLFLYYNGRLAEGAVNDDAGAEIRDVIKGAVAQGVCPESEWPYIDDGKQFAKAPTPNCYTDAIKHIATKYTSIPQLPYNVKYALAIDGHPIVFGFNVYAEFESDEVANSGILPMPADKNAAPEGGHCVMACGYSDPKQMFLCRNSWGADWGQGGYFWMPYAYLLDPTLADDFWQIQLES